jgi:hypothetical protein
MKLLSNTHTLADRKGIVWTLFLLGVLSAPQMLHSQYRKWSVGASVGYNQLRLDAVDDKNQIDVAGWTRQGFMIGPLASVKQSPFYSVSISYRYDREYGFSCSGSYWSKTVSTSYNGPDANLRLERGVGTTDFVFGISYFPSARPYFLDWYIQTNIGITFAQATAKAVGATMVKDGSVLVPVPFVDTDGKYTKSKLIAGAVVGADIPLIGDLSLKAEAGYRFAQIGEMEGDVTQLGVHSVQTSTIDFNFSGFQVSAGFRFQL